MIKRIKHISLGVVVLFLFSGINYLNAQIDENFIEGSVSFITGKNIYVKFISTENIENGDTLFIQKNEKIIPGLIVQHHSSISCLCVAINDIKFKVSDKIYSKSKKVELPDIAEVLPEETPEKDINERVLITPEEENEQVKIQDFSGKLSLSSYSNISSSGDDTYRFRYTFSSKAKNIAESKFSAETYISFTHKLNHWDLVQENLNNALKIYNLALKYDFNETTSLWAGRKINPRIANVGAIDGLQFEYGFKNMYVGIVGGSRPDFQDYGYNFDLFEYGAYFGQSKKVKNGFVQTSFCFV